MVKERVPGSVEDALLMIYGMIGIEAAAKAVERSVTQLYRWADPDDLAQPSLQQALAIDAACLRMTGKAPLLTACNRWMEKIRREQEAQEEAECIQSAVLGVTEDVGHIASLIRQATSPDSDAGKALSREERHALKRVTQHLRESAEALDAAIETGHRPLKPDLSIVS